MCVCVCVCVWVVPSCPTLWDPSDCSLPDSSVHGILQVRILEWAAISYSRGSCWPRDQTQVSCIEGRFFTSQATREARVICTTYLLYNVCVCSVALVVSNSLQPYGPTRPLQPYGPRDQTCVSCVSCIAGRFLTHWTTWEATVYVVYT